MMKNKVALLVAVSALVLASLACRAAEPILYGVTPAPSVEPVVVETVDAVTPSPEPIPVTATSLVGEQEAMVALYERVIPGVVAIQVFAENGGGLGSGFVFDAQGHVVTNYHVVDGGEVIEVDFSDGYRSYAEIVGVDLDSDLAVLKVEILPVGGVTPLPLGDSAKLKIGQTVIAIGNPFGLGGTMTRGIISALGRTLPSDRESPGGGTFSAADLVQTDAAINPGNSGGPLFNLEAEVIGVNRAIITESSSAQGDAVNSGIGFAISSNIVRRVVPEIIKNGKYDYPFMGLSSLNDDLWSLAVVEALELPQPTGVYVLSVVDGSPADKAGIRGASRPSSIDGLQAGGDLIVAIDGIEVKSFDEMMRYLITNKGPGDVVVLTVLRGDERLEVSVTLDKRP
jgi:2-alkenal reductase